ncbi:hypothetical protein [Halobacillus litoralis]|uniref:hypothetical protein n=1 Tax=Halobacillus litoralis TaxID=45668 RepID=UPI00136F2288|nr:hypothetical protein [Halobacillus litoralis]MYL39060.1 hypothetical protein [Halobacillus litoralis]
MVIKVVLLTLLLFQVLYLSVKVKNDKYIKYYIPAFIVSIVTAWSIYKTFTMSEFGIVTSAIFSTIGLFILFVFTKHPPFSKEKM